MKTVTLVETPMNNHGCRGFEVIVLPITDAIGVVVGGESCSSCWQVGHDDGSPPLPVGSIVQLPLWDGVATRAGEMPEGSHWSRNAPIWDGRRWVPLAQWLPAEQVHGPLAWTHAGELVGRSHNELVEDSAEEPQPDCTFVRPGDLEVVGEIPQVAAAYKLRHKEVGFKEFKAVIDGFSELPESNGTW